MQMVASARDTTFHVTNGHFIRDHAPRMRWGAVANCGHASVDRMRPHCPGKTTTADCNHTLCRRAGHHADHERNCYAR